VINAERATVGDAPTFRSKIAATRKDLLTEIVRIGTLRVRSGSRTNNFKHFLFNIQIKKNEVEIQKEKVTDKKTRK
jgi:hypothetical protein